jgi:MFS family permease
MVSGWWIGTLAVGAMALAPDWRWLFPIFFTYAISAAAIPAMNAYVALDIGTVAHDTASTRQIQLAVSTAFAAYMGGAIISPIIGGWVASSFGMRTVLWTSIGWFLASSLTVMSLPPLAPLNPRSIRFRELARALSPSLPRMTRDQVRVYGVLLALFFAMALGGAMVPSYLEDVRGLSVGVIGSLGTATAIGSTIWLLVLGRLSSRTGLVLAAVLMIVAMLGLIYSPGGSLEVPSMAGVYLMLGAFMTVRTVSLSVVSEHTLPEQRGMSFGIVEMLLGLGMFIGPWLAGILYSAWPARPFLLAAALLVPLLGIVWLVLRSPGSRQAAKNKTP